VAEDIKSGWAIDRCTMKGFEARAFGGLSGEIVAKLCSVRVVEDLFFRVRGWFRVVTVP
jgi:hypothetical protein